MLRKDNGDRTCAGAIATLEITINDTMQLTKNAPDTSYFNKPFKAYAKYELCGSDDLSHLPLDRLDRATDALVPIGQDNWIEKFKILVCHIQLLI